MTCGIQGGPQLGDLLIDNGLGFLSRQGLGQVRLDNDGLGDLRVGPVSVAGGLVGGGGVAALGCFPLQQGRDLEVVELDRGLPDFSRLSISPSTLRTLVRASLLPAFMWTTTSPLSFSFRDMVCLILR
ncbi:hypothetical protein SRABI83_00087 [Arthrobacter sp. Bi83]|nr:hypothetical protein SRABI83_00087 [Arthrobacter sp. Bi83]